MFSKAAKNRFLAVLTGSVGAIRDDQIRERAFSYWASVDAQLGRDLRAYVTAHIAEAAESRFLVEPIPDERE